METNGGNMSEIEVISEAEKERLKVLEGVIFTGIKAVFEMGSAMKEIRETRLYRVRCKTWEEYVRDVWDMGKSFVNYQIAASDVIKNLKENGHNCGDLLTYEGTQGDLYEGIINQRLPINEAQARPLTALVPAQQIAAWDLVLEEAGDRKITARLVTSVVEGILKKQDKKKKEYLQREIETSVPADFSQTFNSLIDLIEQYKASKWKGIDKEQIAGFIRQLEAEFLGVKRAE